MWFCKPGRGLRCVWESADGLQNYQAAVRDEQFTRSKDNLLCRQVKTTKPTSCTDDNTGFDCLSVIFPKSFFAFFFIPMLTVGGMRMLSTSKYLIKIYLWQTPTKHLQYRLHCDTHLCHQIWFSPYLSCPTPACFTTLNWTLSYCCGVQSLTLWSPNLEGLTRGYSSINNT